MPGVARLRDRGPSRCPESYTLKHLKTIPPDPKSLYLYNEVVSTKMVEANRIISETDIGSTVCNLSIASYRRDHSPQITDGKAELNGTTGSHRQKEDRVVSVNSPFILSPKSRSGTE